MDEVLHRVQAWAKALKHQVMVLWFVCRHPRTPMPPKLVAVVVVAYALSPIDLIPDFIPLLGYLDDLVLLPLGVWLAIRLMPADVLFECRQQALERERAQPPRPVSRLAGVVIILIWLALAAVLGYVLLVHYGR
ncbi:membrane protein [Ectopseudomonas mendocina]|uniref:Membrane protein n=1 Tax=Ectopseudomonas mendocina TaxID=300 RepID=A0A379IUD6_ECTME|nr:YkvA family protein [Pseudomonas mendocina]SUD39860.1 membrane protein [Pseudomonas mendocina]